MKERVKWVDVLRGIAMFFVIFGHAFVSKDNFIRTYIYSFHMPLFFLISGLTYKKSELKFKEFFFKKCKNLLLPYLFINIFVFIVKLILQYSLGLYNVNLLKSLGSFFIGLGKDLPCIQSWFLISLFIVEILFYLIQRFAKNEKITVLSVVLLAAAGFILSVFSFSFLQVLHIGASLIGLLFFALGYYFTNQIRVIDKFINKKISILVPVVFLPLGFFTAFINGRISMNDNHYNNILLFLISSLLSILSLIIISEKISKFDFLFSYVGKYSLFFFGYHGFVLTVFRKYLPIFVSNNVLTFLTAVITILIMFPLAKPVVEHIPILVGRIKDKKRILDK